MNGTAFQWWVSFEDSGEVGVTATGEDEAKVLAQARRIKSGLEWRRVRSAVRVCIAAPKPKHVNPLS
jgi:hypothetical protein